MWNMKGFEPQEAYNGKRGCMCGCNGNYAKDPNSRAFKARVRKVESFVGPMRPDAANYGDKASYSTDAFMGVRYVYVEENGRNTTVYFK